MKRSILSVFLIVFSSSAQDGQGERVSIRHCQLGRDPVDINRKIDWEKESMLRILEQKEIRMTTGSGKSVQCILPKLTPIVVERDTGIARWILNCGNEIISPPNWIPEGIRIPGEQLIQQIKISPSTLNVNVKVEGEIKHEHSGDINIYSSASSTIATSTASAASASNPDPTPAKKSWWKKKWFIPVLVGGGGAVAVIILKRNTSKVTIQYQPLPPPIIR